MFDISSQLQQHIFKEAFVPGWTNDEFPTAGGYSDSRPKELSIVNGLAFLNFSHCPHYHSEPSRKPLYYQAILDGKLKEGYACDDMAGLLFMNEKLKKSVSLNAENNNYFISVENGKIKEVLLPSEIIK